MTEQSRFTHLTSRAADAAASPDNNEADAYQAAQIPVVGLLTVVALGPDGAVKWRSKARRPVRALAQAEHWERVRGQVVAIEDRAGHRLTVADAAAQIGGDDALKRLLDALNAPLDDFLAALRHQPPYDPK